MTFIISVGPCTGTAGLVTVLHAQTVSFWKNINVRAKIVNCCVAVVVVVNCFA